ncbi:phosphoglucosamine mutase [Candidatus Dependentiae bacterium]|nr:phosphoglucosamine mutase [Candidatus Dependentiae bacterium]
MTKNIFGTDGIRAKVGKNPVQINDLIDLSQSICQWAWSKFGKSSCILISDTRQSCDFIKSLVKGVLLANGIKSYDAGILPTSSAYFFKHLANFAIIISASHNPYYDNGIKIIDLQNAKLTLEDELAISKNFHEKNFQNNYEIIEKETILPDACFTYINSVINLFEENFLKNKKIVLDVANGSTFKVAPEIFTKLGAKIITINSLPNGKNINLNCGALYLENLAQQINETKADFGFAFDGDGDRVIAVNRYGQIKNGDDLLAILTNNISYKNQKSVVGTVMSNQGLENYLKNKNMNLIRTSVGDKYIYEQLTQNNLLLGAEQSGHIILKNILPTGDGIISALKVLETVIETKNWNLETFEKFPQVLLNVPVKFKVDLSKSPYYEIINSSQKSLINGRLLVRFSGTENCLRIMVEEKDEIIANNICYDLADKLQKELT